MISIGNKVMVMPGGGYADRFAFERGTVRNIFEGDRVGVFFENMWNTESKNGLFWFNKDYLNVLQVGILPEDAIKKVIFSGGKTIILWNDDSKTIATCGEGDIFDPYAGFCAAVTKKMFGSTTKARRIVEKNITCQIAERSSSKLGGK